MERTFHYSGVVPAQKYFGLHPFITIDGWDERIRYYEFIWVQAGNCSITIDANSYSIGAGDLLFLVPGQRICCNLPITARYRLQFSADYLAVAIANPRIACWMEHYYPGQHIARIRATTGLQQAIENIIFTMQKELDTHDAARSEILSGLLHILLIHFSRELQPEVGITASKDALLVRRFKTSLSKNYINKKLVTDYASELCVSPNYLNRTVKKTTGFTASYHIQQHIIREAKRKALVANTSMKEVAYFLGFDNTAHFSKYFKNNCGMNFTSFRRREGITN